MNTNINQFGTDLAIAVNMQNIEGRTFRTTVHVNTSTPKVSYTLVEVEKAGAWEEVFHQPIEPIVAEANKFGFQLTSKWIEQLVNDALDYAVEWDGLL